VAGDASDEYKIPGGDSVRVVVAKTTELAKTKGAKEATDFLWTGNHAMGNCLVSKKTRELLLTMGHEYSWWRYIYPSKREYLFPMAIKKLNEIKVPTLVVTAQYDLQLCHEVAAILAREIPGAKLISIKNAGHIMNMDNPKEFNKAIIRFMDSVK
jgi:pimeloyl-ACP methyl ester carboxylesterase